MDISPQSLSIAREKYTSTLISGSYDREFASSLATRILEVKGNEIGDLQGDYESYLTSQVSSKARRSCHGRSQQAHEKR